MKRFLVLALLMKVLSIYGSTNLPAASSLRMGEKSVLEVTVGLARYANPPQLSGKLVSNGSGGATVLINRWAAEFGRLFPNVALEIHGSGMRPEVFNDFIDEKIDIVPMSRPAPPEVISRYKAKFGVEPCQFVIGPDALAVYVNKSNPVAGLTLEQLEAIYSHSPRSRTPRPELWGQLGVTGPLADVGIYKVSLSQLHGSHQFFREVVLGGANYRFDVHFESVASGLVQAVGAEDGAIGFVTPMFATARTRFVPVQATNGQYLLPTYENVISGQYPLIRPMRVLFHRKSPANLNPVVREFLRFAVSSRGQRIIALAGSYPLTPEQQKEALREIGENP